ncbi:hypothetical protein ACFXCZ_35095 [Streptomyces sp. NPDC059396]|uniref:hypothetical protein n=1 Tax=Streptomyces sp. NPDC059396 TaxID=3346819 RepID=UPI0036BA645D
MSYTDQDVREGRLLMNDGRDNRLAMGDKLLSIAARGQDSDFERYCDEIDLSVRTARQSIQGIATCSSPTV